MRSRVRKTDLARNLVVFSAATEFATGAALLIVPATVVALLLGAETSELTALVGRCFGVALVALGLACWPQRGRTGVGFAGLRALLAYNALIALILGYAGAIGQLVGPLLWPAVALHGVVALVLVWTGREGPQVDAMV
jgi:hypothetical protein